MVDQEKLGKDMKEMMDKYPAAMMQVIAGILTSMADKANAGQIGLTGKDNNDEPLYKLLFVTDRELIDILDPIVDKYDKTL